MRHGKLMRHQVDGLIQDGGNILNQLDRENCEPTSRLQTDGDDSAEYSASIHAVDNMGRQCVVVAYYYLTPAEIKTLSDHDNDGSSIDWTIHGYEII